MKKYLVGGAVRDRLLGLPDSDQDWVVTGATPEDLLNQGYRQVGADFPVFIDPKTGYEYALARTERKSGHGYGGFEVQFDPTVSLEDDLARRDLTINAMAEAADGELIDPYGGQKDLQARLLRHVSPAFVEDPLRVLRVARFAARFHGLGFRIAEETMALMRELADSGELAHLVPERVWQETTRALGEKTPDVFISVLHECGALRVVFPEIEALFGVPQRADYHPEVDTGVHLLLCLRQAAEMRLSAPARVAVLLHDLGKGITPAHVLPSHRGHESAGVPLVEGVCERLRVPRQVRDLAVLVCREHLLVHTVFQLRDETVLKLLDRADAVRRAERFHDCLSACEADARGREGLSDQPYPQAAYLRDVAKAVGAVRPDTTDGLSGAQIGQQLQALKLQAVKEVHARWKEEGIWHEQ